MIQNNTTNIPATHVIANATHEQLKQSGNLAYIHLYNTYTKAQAEADTIG
jgi:hypothetical protein